MLTRLVQQLWFYNFAIWAFRTWARIFLGLRVSGQENIPAAGGVVVACNHFSSLDPPIVGVSVPREIHFMAKRELFDRPASRLLLLGLRAFPVKRGQNDTGATRTALRKLQSGLAVGIFIQGTRSSTETAALRGAAFLALRANALLVPTSVWREGRAYRVHFGEPLDTTREGLSPEEATRELVTAINSELPDSQRMLISGGSKA